MAVSARVCWTLALSACLALMVSARANCDADCAYCILHLQLQRTEINTLTCTLECEGALGPKTSWDLCEGVLQERNSGSLTERSQVTTENSEHNSDQHEVAKKYGGFMKRYGGFMKRYGGFMKKMAELYDVEPDNEDHNWEILTKRHSSFGKSPEEGATVGLLEALRDVVREKDTPMQKWIMRSTKHRADQERGEEERGEEEEEEEEKRGEEEKRYGGFMRRVGRPEWREEEKRSWGEEVESKPDIQKRYGGFMGY